jgi:hypothetical protein
MAPFFETDDVVADAIYADAAGYYSGSSVTSISGLWYLRGETVGVLCNGVDIGDKTVTSAGVLTLGQSATTVVWGKRYTSRAVTLRAAQAGNQDGSALGRKKVVNGVMVDLLNTKGLKVGTIINGADDLQVLPRVGDDAAAGVLNTGMFGINTIDTHRGNGVVVMQTDRLYPATIRGVQPSLEGEP